MSGPVTDVAHPPDGVAGMAGANASRPPRRLVLPEAVIRAAPRIGWALMSVGLFAGIWELLWLCGVTDPKLLPPPHIFLGNFPEQAKFFNTAQRWQIGVGLNTGPSAGMALVITVLASAARVFAGLLIASALSITIGVLLRYSSAVRKLALPTITLLSPVSPIPWLPVAIFVFGIGNAPAIFMVMVALFFHMVLATVSQIDGVNRNLINVARTMGASKWQIYSRVIVPAILPGLLMVLRLNMFGAWMVVLVAESTGVGYGLGQVIMLARNTFNPSLVFFTIALIGMLGFCSDWLMRLLQRKILYWMPETTGVLRGLLTGPADLIPGRRGLPQRQQGVGGRHQAGACRIARRRPRRDARGVHRAAGSLRLRQEHSALSDRRPGTGIWRRGLVVRGSRRRSVARAQPDFPGNLAVSMAHRGAECELRPLYPRRKRRGPQDRGARGARPRRPDRSDRQAARRTVRRHAPARGRRTRAGDAAQGAPDGRAVCGA